MTLQEYLNTEFDEGKIDFSIRVYGINNGRPEFYIHPTAKDGKTVDYRVKGNELEEILLFDGSSRSGEKLREMILNREAE